MSLKDKASLIFKPSRYKSGKAYSFRGEDFTFTRSSVATRINSAGNIEEVASGVPRLNYDPNDLTKCPSILLEQSRTNLIDYSEDLNSTPYKSRLIISENATKSPEGLQNADKIIATNVSGSHALDYVPIVVATDYSMSIYAKAGEISKFVLLTNNRGSNVARGFDLRSGTTFTNDLGYGEPTSYSIKEVGNDWYYCTIQFTKTSSGTAGMGVYLTDSNGAYSFVGNDVDGMYFWGWQLEEGSYPTSLIKTNGSSATRAIDLARKTSASSVIGQSEGTIYVEFEYTGVKEHYSPLFSLQGVGSPMELIEIYSGPNGTTYSAVMQDGGVTQLNPAFTPSIGKNKVAFAYATNNSVLVVNGVVIGSVDTACTIPTLYDIGLGSFTYSSSYSLGDSINEALLFKQRLSAEELASLTSFDTYEELVEAKDLTWESPTITNNRLTALKEL